MSQKARLHKMKLLSYSASVTFENVLEEMQSAEELDGCENLNDYLNLMLAISAECNARIENAINTFREEL
jgi:hypothetical protein